jgi:glycine/D-amino acid oxidase-like deaminating enzyme
MLAAANILRHARTAGAQLIPHSNVLTIEQDKSSTSSLLRVKTTTGDYVAPHVINASGTWAGEIAERAGSSLPIMPRKGFILVTAPLPPKIFHKVYDSDYVDNVASSDADLQTSTVVEGTKSGTILIGASRQRVGYNKNIDVSVIKKLATQATSLYSLLRHNYSGFITVFAPTPPIICRLSARISTFLVCITALGMKVLGLDYLRQVAN